MIKIYIIQWIKYFVWSQSINIFLFSILIFEISTLNLDYGFTYEINDIDLAILFDSLPFIWKI